MAFRTRRLLVLAVVAAVLLLVPPGIGEAISTGAPHSTGGVGPAPMASHYVVTARPLSSPVPHSAHLRLPAALTALSNLTLSDPTGMALFHPASGQPVSAVRATPAPWVPATSPKVVTLGTNLKNAGFNQVVNLPNGSWERIILNYTGQVVSSVYDSSYEMWADSVPILFGTTPEYGTWTVLQDVTEYSALLRGSSHLDFRMGDAVIGNGYFLTNLTLSFYPAPPDMALPVVPSSFVPLFDGSNLVPSRPGSFTLAMVPYNVTNATLEVYEYGFGPNGQDEFWYQDLATGSTYREFTISSDGTPLAADYPYPFINTGGIDLFLWRPVTSVATLDNRPQRFDVTSSLPLMEGTHNFTVNFTGISPGSNWFVDADLALYTSPNVTGSVLVYHNDTIAAAPSRAVGSILEERAQANFSSESLIEFSNGTSMEVQGHLSEIFSANITRASLSGGLDLWTNISQQSRSVGSTQFSTPTGVEYLNRTFAAPFSVDLGSRQVLSSSTYPLFVNVTTSILNAVQIWNETFSQTGPLATQEFRSNIIDEMVGANGSWVGEYYVPSSTSSQLVNFHNITSLNSREYASIIDFGGTRVDYSHILISQDTGATSNSALPTVTTDSFDSPMVLEGRSTRSVIDANVTLTFYLEPWGGRAPFTFEWTKMPLGCVSADTADLTCIPSTPGEYPIQALALDNYGDNATATIGTLLVVPDPVAVLFPSSPGVDVGTALNLNASIHGGIAPYTCAWFVDGLLAAPPGSCSAPYQTTPASVGTLAIKVVVTDSEGVNGITNLSVVVAAPVSVSVTTTLGHGTDYSLPQGTVVNLSADVAHGIAPFNVSWYEDGAPVALGSHFNLTVGRAGQSVSVYATVGDSGGGTNQSASLTISSTSGAISPPTQCFDCSSNPGSALLAIELTTVAAILIFGPIVYLLIRRRRQR